MNEAIGEEGVLSVGELHEFLWERVRSISGTGSKFLENQLAGYRSNAFVRIAGFMPMLVTTLFQRATRFVFFGDKYSHLISSLPNDQVSLIGGFGTYRLARRLGLRFVPVISLTFLLWLDYSTGSRIFLALARGAVRAYFRRVKPDCLILTHDLLPIDRLLATVAREAGARVIVVAHGLYQSKSPRSLIDGQVADAVLVYDDHQREIFSRAGARCPIVMGFHSNVARRAPVGNVKEVCFIGQPWGKHYGIEFARRYEKVLRSLVEALKRPQSTVYYKPHQLESDDQGRLECAGVNIFLGSLEDAFVRFDYFFAVGSTALFEATLAGKISVQLFDPAFECDRFDKFGYAHVIEAFDEEEISRFQCLKPVAVPELHYIDVGRRFGNVIDRLAPGGS